MPIRDEITGRFLSGSKLCTCGSGHCEYHRQATARSYEKYRETRRAESRAYYHSNRDKMRQQNKAWVKENKEFSRRRCTIRRRSGARLSKVTFEEVMDYYGRICVYCGTETTGIDHLVPLSHGGSGNAPENLAPCCPKCNSVKGTRPIWVMLGREEVMMRLD